MTNLLPRILPRILPVMALAGAVLIQGAEARINSGALDRNQIKRLVVEEAQATTLPPSLALALAKVESDFEDGALSDKGARGVMQIMPRTARAEFGVSADELWDARLNIQLGISFLEQLIQLPNRHLAYLPEFPRLRGNLSLHQILLWRFRRQSMNNPLLL